MCCILTTHGRGRLSRMTLLTLLMALASALALSGTAAAKSPKPTTAPFDRTTLLVGFAHPEAAASTVAAAGDSIETRIGRDVALVKIRAGRAFSAKRKESRARHDVLFAEPNYVVK